MLLSIKAALYSPSNVGGSSFSTSLATLVVFCVFVLDSSHPNGYVMISHCGFDLHFPIAHLFICILVIYVSSLEKCLFKCFAHVLIVCVLLLLSCSDNYFRILFSFISSYYIALLHSTLIHLFCLLCVFHSLTLTQFNYPFLC